MSFRSLVRFLPRLSLFPLTLYHCYFPQPLFRLRRYSRRRSM